MSNLKIGFGISLSYIQMKRTVGVYETPDSKTHKINQI